MEILKTEKNIEIIVPVTKYWMHLFLFGITSIIMVPLFIFVILKIIITLNFNFPQELYGLLICTPIFANYALWLYKGKEILSIENDLIEYIRTNGIITIRKKYEIQKIKNITTKEKKFKSDSFIDTKRELIKEMQRAFPFWINMGKINFQYQEKNINILNGINNSEMSEVCELLINEIEKRTK
ncbi:hypothetical protein AB3G33_09805 [Flavobacterium sp. WC2421]|uniref:hypothetical protein n=1 Tax=Flavobacterium sp. WC2421 TaxID=3234138 RepID=UPI003464EB62